MLYPVLERRLVFNRLHYVDDLLISVLPAGIAAVPARISPSGSNVSQALPLSRRVVRFLFSALPLDEVN